MTKDQLGEGEEENAILNFAKTYANIILQKVRDRGKKLVNVFF